MTEAAQQAALAAHQPKWPNKKVLALGAGAEFGPSKRWPAAYYADLAKMKLDEATMSGCLAHPKTGRSQMKS